MAQAPVFSTAENKKSYLSAKNGDFISYISALYLAAVLKGLRKSSVTIDKMFYVNVDPKNGLLKEDQQKSKKLVFTREREIRRLSQTTFVKSLLF